MLKRLFLEHFPVQELFSDTLNTTWTNPCFLKWWAVLLLGVNLFVVCLPLRILLIRRSVFLLKDSFSLSLILSIWSSSFSWNILRWLRDDLPRFWKSILTKTAALLELTSLARFWDSSTLRLIASFSFNLCSEISVVGL